MILHEEPGRDREQGRHNRVSGLGRREAQRLSEKIEQAMDRLLDCDSPSLQTRFEAKIKTMETERAVLLEQASAAPNGRTFDESLRTAMRFLADPWNLWTNGALKDRHAVLKLAFPQGLRYSRIQGLTDRLINNAIFNAKKWASQIA